MWIIYGTKTSNKIHGKVLSAPCSECHNNIFSLDVAHKYFHIYGIPFVPTGKATNLVCDNCHRIYESVALSEQRKKDIKNSRKKSSPPFYLFTGLFLLTLLIAFASWRIYQDKLEEQAFLKKPVLGDYYIVNYKNLLFSSDNSTDNKPDTKTDQGPYNYGVLKIVEINKEKLILLVSNYTYKYPTDAKKSITNGTMLMQKDYFTDYIYELPQNKLFYYYDNGDIQSVYRMSKYQELLYKAKKETQ